MRNSILTIFACLLAQLTTAQQFDSLPRTRVNVITENGNFDRETDSILQMAIPMLTQAINSQQFADKVMQADFSKRNKKTNNEILKMIRTGHEPFSQADGIINLILRIDLGQNGSEVGETNIVVNYKDDTNAAYSYYTHSSKAYIMRNGAACYAAHLAHEYCHVLGFTHPKVKIIGSIKARSVPYQVGNFVEEILGVKCP